MPKNVWDFFIFPECLSFQLQFHRNKILKLCPRFFNKFFLKHTVDIILKTSRLGTWSSVKSVVSKVFEKLVNHKIVDHLEYSGLFSDFQYGLRSS